jgi:hypothetical protein
MRGHLEEYYRGHLILAAQVEGAWQARIDGIGALSDCRPTAQDAIGETKRYLDDQAAERGSAIR